MRNELSCGGKSCSVRSLIVFTFFILLTTIIAAAVWVPLSRLSHCLFLVHPMILWSLYAAAERTLPFTYLELLTRFFSNLFGCYGAALILYLLVERPIQNILNVLMVGSSSMPQKATKEE